MFGKDRKREKQQEQERQVWALHMIAEQYKQAFVELKDVQEQGLGVFAEAVASEAEFEQRKEQFGEDTEKIRTTAVSMQEQLEKISQGLCTVQNGMEQAEAYIEKLEQTISQQKENILQSMELNKHVTTPIKTLNDMIGRIKRERQSNERKSSAPVALHSQDAVQQLVKQIENMSLEAAIEAGRMGESGKKFVETAQQIRAVAEQCRKTCEEQSAGTSKETARKEEVPLEILEGSVTDLTATLKNSSVLLGQMSKQEKPEMPDTADLKKRLTELGEQAKQLRDDIFHISEIGNEISMDGERMAEAFADSKDALEQLEAVFDQTGEIIKNVSEEELEP